MQSIRKVDKKLKLAPPGEGLPLLESFILKIVFPRLVRVKSRAHFAVLFAKELEKIRHLLENVSPRIAGTPVLIKRIRGIEDSSRFWSAYMTVDHLNIVNSNILVLIENLAKETEIQKKVEIAEVKPKPHVDGEVIDSFRSISENFISKTNQIPNLSSKAKHYHPWFGDMNAYSWFALAAVHMGIHRKQIELILEGCSID